MSVHHGYVLQYAIQQVDTEALVREGSTERKYMYGAVGNECMSLVPSTYGYSLNMAAVHDNPEYIDRPVMLQTGYMFACCAWRPHPVYCSYVVSSGREQPRVP